MPIITSTYKPPVLFRNGYVSTVYSGLRRKVEGVSQERERLTLADGDFLDIDWSFAAQKTKQLAIILHGLEGNAQRPYMLGAAKQFNANGVDAACINFRGCSGEDNRYYRSYHSGDTGDLKAVIDHVLSSKKYTQLYLKGFSLGANVLLKYLGEGNGVPNEIKAAVAVSVPCYLKGSCDELHKLKNWPYANMFLGNLKTKLKQKQQKFPEQINGTVINSIKSLIQFDHAYTSKAHGFKDAFDYYEQSSSLQFLPNIKIPTLIINAKNDSFLSSECFPLEAAKQNPNLFLDMPKYGGHVGFYESNNVYYNESKAITFFENYLNQI